MTINLYNVCLYIVRTNLKLNELLEVLKNNLICNSSIIYLVFNTFAYTLDNNILILYLNMNNINALFSTENVRIL